MNGVVKWVQTVMGAGIGIIPLFLTYMLVMATLKGLGAIGGAVLSASDRSQKAGKNFAQGIRDDRKNIRRRNELEGRGMVGRRAITQWGARRAAKRASNETGAKRAETEYVADTAVSNDAFASALAGGDEARKAGVVAAAVNQQKKAFQEDVSDMEALIKIKFDNDPEKALKDAIESGNKAQAVAAQNMLFAKGGSGVSKFREIVEESEKTTEGQQKLDNVSGSLRENLQERHGKQAKDKGADLVTWAGKGGKLTDAKAGAMSDNDLAGQHAASIEKMVNQGGVISGDQARRVLSDPRVSANLNDDQKKQLVRAAGGDLRPAPTDKELTIAHEEADVQNKLHDMENNNPSEPRQGP
ncbi:MAG TPA: hypothetical protein VFH06_01175 [Candidatus Saccharimonadales bacterium]|nr:hypothetical protein [Candidatus Saccharimonadales bacterium]